MERFAMDGINRKLSNFLDCAAKLAEQKQPSVWNFAIVSNDEWANLRSQFAITNGSSEEGANPLGSVLSPVTNRYKMAPISTAPKLRRLNWAIFGDLKR